MAAARVRKQNLSKSVATACAAQMCEVPISLLLFVQNRVFFDRLKIKKDGKKKVWG